MAEVDGAFEARGLSRIGSTLKGKYRLDNLIGVGGMAIVYAATHRNSKRFAVKVLHSELSIHDDLRVRFMREGYVANRVEHPGAVAVIDDDVTEDGAAFLVMELLEGEAVDEIAARRGDKLPVRVVLGLSYQLLDVLAAADAKGIVHRDIKPANLFVTRDGQLKVLDFGVARMRDAQGALTTHVGHTLGTPAFMAPEQALGRTDEIDGRTDLWAVGATMFSLLTAQVVHQASTGQEQMVFAATKHARTLAEVGATEVPRRVAEIVEKALAFRREDRWAHASEMRDAVGNAYRELYGEKVSTAALAAVVSQVKLAVFPATSKSDPLASTASAEAVEPPAPKASPAEAKSLEATTARARRAHTSRRLRFVGGASLLVVAGAAIGAWAVRSPPATTMTTASTGVVTAPALLPLPAPTLTPSAAPEPARSAEPAAPAPSATAASPLPATSTSAAASRPSRRAPPPSPSSSGRPPHDSFDHQ